MSNNTLLIVNAPKKIKKLLSRNPKYIFYDNWCFSQFDIEKKENSFFSINELKLNQSHSETDYNDDSLILKMTYVWDRWLRGSSDLKLFREITLSDLAKIRTFFLDKKIKKVLFYTGAPHHIDTSLLSCCLNSLKIPEYYLFKVPVGTVIFIIKGSNLFSKKEQYNENLTDYDSKNDIDKFIFNFKSGYPTKMKARLVWWNTNFYSSMFLGILYFFWFFLFKPKQHRYISSNHKLLRFIKDIYSQKSFLSMYKDMSKINANEYLKKQRKIIIVAHSQPEASTVPMGGNYSSHINLILKIRSLGISDDIFYKEHAVSKIYFDTRLGPTGVGGYRSKQYLETLSSLGVKFVPIDESDLRKNNNWIITITGTVAIERSLVGLKTIVAGNPWFEGLPGTIPIDQVTKDLLNTDPNDDLTNVSKKAMDFLINIMDNNCLPVITKNTKSDHLNKHLDFINKLSENI